MYYVGYYCTGICLLVCHDQTRIMSFSDNDKGEVPFPLHHSKGILYQDNITVGVSFGHLTKVIFVRLLHSKAILSPCLYSILRKEVTVELSYASLP